MEKQVGKMTVEHHEFRPPIQRRATYCRVCKLEIVPGELCVTLRELYHGLLTPPRLHKNCARALAWAMAGVFDNEKEG